MERTIIVVGKAYYYEHGLNAKVIADTDVMNVNIQFNKPAVVIECMFGWEGDNTLGFVRENFDEDSAIGEFYTAIAKAPLSMYRLVSVSDDNSSRAFGNLEIPGLIPYTETQICWR